MAAPSPEPGVSAEAVLRRVELQVARRLDGLLQGERRGRRPGPGGEASITRPYQAGDDVRWVDWPLTARSLDVMVRVPELEPVLTAWALLDRSPSMDFGSAVQTKAALAREVLAGIGTVMRRRGDRLGVVASGSGDLDLVLPPRADRRGLAGALRAIDLLPPAVPGARTDLARAITSLGRVARHRGAVVILSDLPLQPGLERAIGALGRLHEVIAVEVRDPRERAMPRLGVVRLRDMETGATRLVDTADPRFQERFAAGVAAADAERAALLARAGARHLIVETGADWVAPLARVLSRPLRRRRTAALPAGATP